MQEYPDWLIFIGLCIVIGVLVFISESIWKAIQRRNKMKHDQKLYETTDRSSRSLAAQLGGAEAARAEWKCLACGTLNEASAAKCSSCGAKK